MRTLKIEVLNPKAKRLLLNLAELKLISITSVTENPFEVALKRIRSKKAKIKLEDITKEEEVFRAADYARQKLN